MTAKKPGKEETNLNNLDLAVRRTRLAEERTYNAWLRTGMATMAFGLVIARFFTAVGPIWLLNLLAAFFVLGGGITILLAFRTHYRQAKEYGEMNEVHTPVWASGGLGILLIVVTTAVLVLILLESGG